MTLSPTPLLIGLGLALTVGVGHRSCGSTAIAPCTR